MALALSVGLAACSKDGDNPMAPSGPLPPGSTVVYSAVGASDVVGVGSSKVCLPFEDCDGNGYVWVAARRLRGQGHTVNVWQLGIPAAVISRSFQDLAAQYGRITGGNFLQSEMPFVRADATLVTVFAGANDVNTITAALGGGAGGSNPAAYIDQQVAAFRADMLTLIDGIRDRAKSARIVVLNLPNVAGLPYLAGASLAQKQAAQRAAVGITTTAINTLQGVTVVDLMCDARLYQASIYSDDGFHPNDNGYAMIGAEIASAATGSYPAPRASCPQMTLF